MLATIASEEAHSSPGVSTSSLPNGITTIYLPYFIYLHFITSLLSIRMCTGAELQKQYRTRNRRSGAGEMLLQWQGGRDLLPLSQVKKKKKFQVVPKFHRKAKSFRPLSVETYNYGLASLRVFGSPRHLPPFQGSGVNPCQPRAMTLTWYLTCCWRIFFSFFSGMGHLDIRH
ncbi:hypothetical protein NPIL_280831 [Nephila pilipes]|uniref:Uncharacterized protein n=1 Tax=Nephila pilipes TaxID=299642 RepID=A0A8X6MES0_NEPPI|nr:hypothetical protein NPIL_280831 [Nephila pilipes]